MVHPDIALLFRHLIEGVEISCPEKLLKISAKAACKRHEPILYSFAENLWHAVYWQDHWLDALDGAPTGNLMQFWQNDWQTPTEKEFSDLKNRFLHGLLHAQNYCVNGGYKVDEETAKGLLTRIAVHGTYHVGQLTLIKRAGRLANS